jgi:hypothetical protein
MALETTAVARKWLNSVHRNKLVRNSCMQTKKQCFLFGPCKKQVNLELDNRCWSLAVVAVIIW